MSIYRDKCEELFQLFHKVDKQNKTNMVAKDILEAKVESLKAILIDNKAILKELSCSKSAVSVKALSKQIEIIEEILDKV